MRLKGFRVQSEVTGGASCNSAGHGYMDVDMPSLFNALGLDIYRSRTSYMRKGYPLTVIGRVKRVVEFMHTPMGTRRATSQRRAAHGLSVSGQS